MLVSPKTFFRRIRAKLMSRLRAKSMIGENFRLRLFDDKFSVYLLSIVLFPSNFVSVLDGLRFTTVAFPWYLHLYQTRSYLYANTQVHIYMMKLCQLIKSLITVANRHANVKYLWGKHTIPPHTHTHHHHHHHHTHIQILFRKCLNMTTNY